MIITTKWRTQSYSLAIEVVRRYMKTCISQDHAKGIASGTARIQHPTRQADMREKSLHLREKRQQTEDGECLYLVILHAIREPF